METFDTPDPITVSVELEVGNVRIDADERTDTTVEVRPSDPEEESRRGCRRADAGRLHRRPSVRQGPEERLASWVSWRRRVRRRRDRPAGRIARADRGRCGVAPHHRPARRDPDQDGRRRPRLDEVGPMDIKTGAGDVSVDRAVGQATIASGSGAVRIGAVDGPAAKNGNSDTWIGGELTGESRACRGSISRRAHVGVVANGQREVRIGDVARGAVVAQSAFGARDRRPRRRGRSGSSRHEVRCGGERAGRLVQSGSGDDVVEVHAHTSATSPSTASSRRRTGRRVMTTTCCDRGLGSASPSATRSRSTGSISASGSARSSRCSGRTAPARRRPSTSCRR